MVVACIALFMAMGGVSYGLATGAIDSREIKNNTVRGKDVRNGSVTGRDVKRDGLGGLSINESRLGTVPFAEALSHTAVVSSGGQLIRGRSVSSAARTSTGRYQVIFNRDVRGCVYVATVGDTSAAGPPAGTASVTSLGSNVNGVAVRTVDYGTNGDALTNKPFHLMVSC
jgi:hypothetical protein